MPRLNGIELTRRIRQELPQTTIILMSSYPEDAYRLMASASGADAFVNKQVLNSSLPTAIRDVICRRLSGGFHRARVHHQPRQRRRCDDLQPDAGSGVGSRRPRSRAPEFCQSSPDRSRTASRKLLLAPRLRLSGATAEGDRDTGRRTPAIRSLKLRARRWSSSSLAIRLAVTRVRDLQELPRQAVARAWPSHSLPRPKGGPPLLRP